jgi:hypothetical protein
MAQSDVAKTRIEANAVNRPLPSLKAAIAAAAARGTNPGPPREIVNFRGAPEPVLGGDESGPDSLLQSSSPAISAVSVSSGFFGTSNNDNGQILGFLVAPPDTDGDVGPSHYVQMINLLTTVFDKSGNVVSGGGPFASNAFWSGIGGNCEPNNQGDPIVLYDDVANRWLVSQFAFPDAFNSFSQCVAVSQGGDPLGGYNRYEFSFNGIGFPDYPKHGIVSDSITLMANLFVPQGPFFNFGGTFIGVMDKAAMYAGSSASLIGFNLGTSEFGFVAGDLDGSGSAPALFATAMSTSNAFDVWQVDVDWNTENASASQIASISIPSFDADLCSASREACVPQPDGGPALEAISDRLMHRLQIRDFGTHRSMLATHTVDVGGGRAGVRWYEFRESSGTWSLYQGGTFGPNDGEHRFMPSIAMNAAGDIGLGYMLSSTNTYVSTVVNGQTAASSGSGTLDAGEVICAAGSGVQTGTARSGDYSASKVDEASGNFWHTNEVFTQTGQFQWNTFVCEFSAGNGGGGNQPPNASFTFSCDQNTRQCDFDASGSSDPDGTIAAYDWTFGDGMSGSGQMVSHTYANYGDFTVTLTVTDDLNAMDSDQQVVMLVDPNVITINLAASGFKVQGKHNIDLTWTTNSTATNFDVYRNGGLIATTPNDGAFTDATQNKGKATYTHQVCEAGSQANCSNVTVTNF